MTVVFLYKLVGMKFISAHPAFNDTIDSLKNEFKNDRSNDLILCVVHDFSRSEKNSIGLFNLAISVKSVAGPV